MTILSLYISNNYRTGGQKRFVDLLMGLANRGHSIILLKRAGRDLPLDGIQNGSIIEISVSGTGSQNQLFLKGIRRKLHNEPGLANQLFKADVILQFGESTRSAILWLKKRFLKPSLIAIRNNWVEANRNLYKSNKYFSLSFKLLKAEIWGRLVEKSTASAADFLVFQSKYDRNSFLSRTRFPKKFTAIIPNSLESAWFSSEWENCHSSNRLQHILFIGNEDPRKGLDVLLKAVDHLKQQSQNRLLIVDIVGRFSPELQAQLKEIYPLVNPHFVGVIENVFPLMQKADLLVVPSFYDSFPNTVMEALHVGLPVIGTDVAGIAVMLKGTGLLFPPGDAVACANLIKSLTDQGKYSEAKKACFERRDNFKFSWYEQWEEKLVLMMKSIKH